MVEGKQRKNGTVRRNYKLAARSTASLVLVIIITLIVLGVRFLVNKFRYSSTSQSYMISSWEDRDYEKAYEISRNILEQVDFSSNLALTYHGYSAFYLAISDNDTAASLAYLDDAINSMRLAMINAGSDLLPQLNYMLGKAYFYKDTYSSYNYYADLAVKYLKNAQELGYDSKDIPELLGLSYVALDMTMESIAAFSQALLVRESDSLLLSMAEQYYKTGQGNIALQYLYRISQDCTDERILDKSRVIFANVYLDDGKYEEAEKEFNGILEKNENSADAYYGLGVLYEKQGDLVKARAYWRKALKVQHNHPGALKKMTDNK
ncbi:MAG: tetratricopeptide repeat protein [Treponema sp.]|nr:tetratricopeptide repeat protein [Treponema sp.]